MFDQSKLFDVPVVSPDDPTGKKFCTVRFPTDDEWCARVRKIRPIRQTLGRGKSQYEVSRPEEIDGELFAKIRQDRDGPEFDDFEASRVIERLERCKIVETSRSGIEVSVSMVALGERMEHFLRIPSARDMTEFSRAAVRVIDGRRSQEIRVSLEPSGALWDKLKIRVEGYAGEVPIIHKDRAIVELLAQLEQDDDDPEL